MSRIVMFPKSITATVNGLDEGAGPRVSYQAAGQDATAVPLSDPSGTFDQGYWYQLPDGASIVGVKNEHTGASINPSLLVDRTEADCPYPLKTKTELPGPNPGPVPNPSSPQPDDLPDPTTADGDGGATPTTEPLGGGPSVGDD